MPDVETLLDVIADTAGDLEDQISALKSTLDVLRPYLPAASDMDGEPGAGVAP